MENGYVGYPKFKRRKISAVRDFPPGCVPAPKISEKEEIGVHSDEKLVFKDKKEVLGEANCTNSSNAVADSLQVNFASLSNEDVSKKIPTKNYPPRRRVSAVRNFPPGCGKNAPSLDKGQFQEVCGSPKKQHLNQDKTDALDQLVKEAKKADLNITKFVASDGISNANTTKAGLKRSRGSVLDGYAQEDNLLTPNAETQCQDQGINHLGDNMDKKLQFDLKHSDVLNKNVADSKNDESNISEVKAEAENAAMETVNLDALPITSIKMVQLDSTERFMGPAANDEKYQIGSMSVSVDIKGTTDDRAIVETPGKEIVVYDEKNHFVTFSSDSAGLQKDEQEENMKCLGHESTRMVVQGLMAAQNCPWRQKRASTGHTHVVGAGERKVRKHDYSKQNKKRPFSSTGSAETQRCKREHGDKSVSFAKNTPEKEAGPLFVSNKDSIDHDLECKDFRIASRSQHFGVSPPPFGFNNSSGRIDDNDAIVTRQKVRETLRLFQAVCRKLLQEEEAKSKEGGTSQRRIDLQAAKILKEKGKSLHTSKKRFGAVPGVEVGDEFHYRVELHIIGVHGPIQAGIDYMKHEGRVLATSIVASGGYEDDLDNPDSLIYSGSGGNVTKGAKEAEDQKLDRGNLALKNSIDAKFPVRVIRGFKETKSSEFSDARTKALYIYTYDGLYMVERYWQEPGPLGNLVFKFQLGRLPGQPELAWREVKNSKKNKIRKGVCIADISQGKEKRPICAVNTVDKEKPPPFAYVTRMIYPDWLHPKHPGGCSDCRSGCTDSNCSCAVKNGGEIPYNYDGAIVEAKPLVYECGPTCICPPSCRNRVSQHGIKFQLEIFKTEQRGWGVRSLNSIPSGSFVCEYVGELIDDKEAEERTGNDEYLFDIGSNFNDSSLWGGISSLMPDAHSNATETVNESGFTIDAAQFGNVGRFINHSCSPNLYAQNVLYDHEDKRIPHVMLFAAENIPPLQELTYHYNYMIDQVHDSAGNIKKKDCYCGSLECSGRLY